METRACIEVDWSCLDQTTYANTLADTPEVIQRAEMFAQLAIQRLSGYQSGNCPVTVRPCIGSCAGVESAWLTQPTPFLVPFIRDGRWYNSCGCRPAGCSCSALTSIILPGPIGTIDEVKVDGQTIVKGVHYRVDDNSELVRLSGPEWPTCQDMTLADTEVGTISVTYTQGLAWDAGAAFIAGKLAQQYLNACNGDECQLPSSITTLVRNGVTFELGDTVFPNNKTGIPEVDLWVDHLNPYGRRVMSGLFSPDVVDPRRAGTI